MNNNKLQIALDYLMVFTFVLFVFVLIFASVAKQRVLISNQQTFAQLQLVAQSIASELTAASQSGNGYSATIPLPPQLSILEYNISITRQGMVIASSNTLGQNIQATAFALVQSVVSNSIYLSQSKLYYVIPTVESTGYITLQNSFGNICVDYQCASTSNQSSQLLLTTQTAYAIYLNGYNNYAQTSLPVTSSKVESISFWMKTNVVGKINQYIIDQGSAASPNNNWLDLVGGQLVGGPSLSNNCGTTLAFKANTWYFITYTVNSMLSIYVNADPNLGCSVVASGQTPLGLSVGEIAAGGSYFNGSISNLQIYSSSLTRTQINSLYGEGITGSPISGNIVAWYPFQGNGNDYSGNQNDLVVNGPQSYPTVGQIYASIQNASGSELANVSTGFITNLGKFIMGQSTINATNSNGIGYAMLNQNNATGYALVQAEAFNGNSSTKGNVVAWYPMSDGQGMIVHDVSSHSNTANTLNGNIIGAYWASPNFVTQFDGSPGGIQIQDAPTLQASTITISSWVNYAAPNGQFDFFATKSGAWALGTCGQSLNICYYNPSTQVTTYANSILATGQWYLITQVISSGTSETTYVNGVPVLTSASTIASQANDITLGYGMLGTNTFFINATMANLQIYSSALTQSQISSIYSAGISGIPLQGATLVGWWPLNGDAKDYSGYGNNGIIYGNAKPVQFSIQNAQPSQPQVLSAGFNGVNSYISMVSSNSLLPPYNVLVSAWVKTTSPAGGVIMSNAGSSVGYDLSISAASGQASFWTASCPVTLSAGPSLQTGQWYFIAGSYNGTAEILYVDGARIASLPCSASATELDYGAGPYYPVIGAQQFPPSYISYFQGNITDLEVYNMSPTAAQIAQLYNEGIQGLPLQNSGLGAWLPLNGDYHDYSTNGNQASPSNVLFFPQTQTQPNQVYSLSGTGILFNGLNGNVIVSNNIPVSGIVTVNAWVNLRSTHNAAGNRMEVVGKYDSYIMSVNQYGNDEADFYVYHGSCGIGCPSLSSPYSLNVGQWYMLTGVYDGNNVYLYLNGVPVNTVAYAGTITADKAPTVIGSWESPNYNNFYFNGTISDVQIYNSSLTQSQVYQLYSAGAPPYASVSVPLGVSP